jgi:hypothetical protein
MRSKYNAYYGQLAVGAIYEQFLAYQTAVKSRQGASFTVIHRHLPSFLVK